MTVAIRRFDKAQNVKVYFYFGVIVGLGSAVKNLHIIQRKTSDKMIAYLGCLCLYILFKTHGANDTEIVLGYQLFHSLIFESLLFIQSYGKFWKQIVLFFDVGDDGNDIRAAEFELQELKLSVGDKLRGRDGNVKQLQKKVKTGFKTFCCCCCFC